ncbi:type II toxin-antitoxin system death-on-curing family toxin [Legionella israelensis]|uniref:Type II toxin-antitoxin system death-on-curing family toxin n=1 Tax=Legionella israelensis TaxID=454 RepID=A0AAX1ECU0_9GAMM|nr:type II toxin-antitoxin system death-on-curing family toxin [Legionella israelensis]QBR82918.1 type II toxin-antitoxin system death-on-curing family toxin [Legionella israelensis]
MSDYQFISVDDVIDIQKSILAKAPVTNVGKLESGLKRAEQYYYYDDEQNIVMLASYIILGVAKAHAFPDGNKRTAFLSGAYFLDINGYEIKETPEELANLVEALSSGRLEVKKFAAELAKFVFDG